MKNYVEIKNLSWSKEESDRAFLSTTKCEIHYINKKTLFFISC